MIILSTLFTFINPGIRTYLLENEQECPTCGAEDVSPDSLIINKQLRQVSAVDSAFVSGDNDGGDGYDEDG